MRARTMKEYRELILQGLLEIEELRQAVEFEEEGAPIPPFADALQHSLEALLEAAADEDYELGGEELDFAPLLERYDVTELPFRYLLERIVRTHSQGLDEEGADRSGLEEITRAH